MTASRLQRLKLVAGVVTIDGPRWAPALWGGPGSWVRARNRGDVLEVLPDGSGARVGGDWTSEMHASRVIRSLGRRLYSRALAEHPIALSDLPPSGSSEGGVEVSVLIGHRGLERLPHLLMTLRSFAAQRDAELECVVVEQGPRSEIRDRLPAWVRYVHQDWPEDEPYGRSHAFNLGAERAQGRVLVLHDNDMLVPADYVARVTRCVRDGFDVVNLKRFIFYLSEADTLRAFTARVVEGRPEIAAIVQNLLGGGSVATTREAYEALGGFDETFVGWGGEDEEFWERAQTRRVHSWGCMPIVHLWHAPQPGKAPEKRAAGARRLEERRSIPVDARIEELRARRDARRAAVR